MFTGIIQETAKISNIKNISNNFTLYLDSKILLRNKDIGTSIALNGVCLTLVDYVIRSRNLKILKFNLSKETLGKSSFKFKKKGDLLNLEKSLKYGDEIAGHFVQGHVDDIGHVISFLKKGNSWELWIKVKKKFKKYLVPKGSISIDGISLTINEIKNEMFRVNIIPHTIRKTNLKFLKKKSIVNIEFDVLMKFLKNA